MQKRPRVTESTGDPSDLPSSTPSHSDASPHAADLVDLISTPSRPGVTECFGTSSASQPGTPIAPSPLTVTTDFTFTPASRLATFSPGVFFLYANSVSVIVIAASIAQNHECYNAKKQFHMPCAPPPDRAI